MFPLFYLGWTYLFWGLVLLSGSEVWSFPNVVFFLVGGASPLLAGLGLAWLERGAAGLTAMGRGLTDPGRIGGRWWSLLLLYHPVQNLLVAGFAVLTGATAAPLEVIDGDRLLDPAGILGLTAVALLMPIPEEVGLRGWWLDHLQERWSALTASLVLGTTWAAWHVPLLFMEGYYDATTFQPEPISFLGNLVLGAVLYTWIYNATGGSLLAVVVFHCAGNLTGEIMGLDPALHLHGLVATGLVVSLVTLGAGPKTLGGAFPDSSSGRS